MHSFDSEQYLLVSRRGRVITATMAPDTGWPVAALIARPLMAPVADCAPCPTSAAANATNTAQKT